MINNISQKYDIDLNFSDNNGLKYLKNLNIYHNKDVKIYQMFSKFNIQEKSIFDIKTINEENDDPTLKYKTVIKTNLPILEDKINLVINSIAKDRYERFINFNIELEFINLNLNSIFEYNKVNNLVSEMINKRDKLLEQNKKNQTIIRSRDLIKKKIEFHKYWISIIYNIIFYTHLILTVIIILILLYKLL